jgi:hypothetical protein
VCKNKKEQRPFLNAQSLPLRSAVTQPPPPLLKSRFPPPPHAPCAPFGRPRWTRFSSVSIFISFLRLLALTPTHALHAQTEEKRRMALVNVTNVTVLDNPTVFTNPFQFEVDRGQRARVCFLN